MKTEEPDLTRSATMRAVKSRNTKPELEIRSFLHRNGYRFRLHRRDLPGKPDIIFPSRNKAVFVNGCFWHGHTCQRGSRVPKNNRPYWVAKIAGNKKRDVSNYQRLEGLGWHVFVVWECQTKNMQLLGKLRRFLDLE